ncbi:hypothetical protein NQZ68_008098 [Dissostichus eleginoides]|nr:hypothetical protein NQZ68_008098 [Dissostichus eleginoides]
MRGVPLPGQHASEVGAFALARAQGHTDSGVGLALFPSHFHPHSSLGNVDLFLTSSSRSKASGDHQQSSAKKCVGIVWMGRGRDF